MKSLAIPNLYQFCNMKYIVLKSRTRALVVCVNRNNVYSWSVLLATFMRTNIVWGLSMLCISDCLRYELWSSKLYILVQSTAILAVWSLSKTSPKQTVEMEPLMLPGVYLMCFGFISCLQMNLKSLSREVGEVVRRLGLRLGVIYGPGRRSWVGQRWVETSSKDHSPGRDLRFLWSSLLCPCSLQEVPSMLSFFCNCKALREPQGPYNISSR